jgi:hypothetical protein
VQSDVTIAWALIYPIQSNIGAVGSNWLHHMWTLALSFPVRWTWQQWVNLTLRSHVTIVITSRDKWQNSLTLKWGSEFWGTF